MNIYETPKLFAEYLLFHYGADHEVLPWDFGPKGALGFAVRSVTELADKDIVPPQACALDLGCAVGRSSYELALLADEVIGIDYSQSFVDAAEQIRSGGSIPYLRTDEGRLFETALEAVRPTHGDPSRISFEQGDAMNLRPDLGSFDIVHAANLLCRLTEPKKLLDRLPHLVKPGGQLLLTTPCTWLEEYTPPGNQPQTSTAEWLENELSANFTRAYRADLPFLIREHARKFQWSVAFGSRWIRR